MSIYEAFDKAEQILNGSGKFFFAAGLVPRELLDRLSEANWEGTVIDATHRPLKGFRVIRCIADVEDKLIAKAVDQVYYQTCTIRRAVKEVGGGADFLVADSLDILMTAPWESWTPRAVIVRHGGRWEEVSNFLFNTKGYRTEFLNDYYIVMRGPS